MEATIAIRASQTGDHTRRDKSPQLSQKKLAQLNGAVLIETTSQGSLRRSNVGSPSHQMKQSHATSFKHGRVTAGHFVHSPSLTHQRTRRQSTVWQESVANGEENSNMEQLVRLQGELSETFEDLDVKLNKVLAKQEYEYMQTYTHYVKKKERELKDMIELLGEKATNADRVKDQKIRDLEKLCRAALANETKMEKQVRDLKDSVRKLKDQKGELESDQEFFKRKTLDAKRKNKLLKTAIQRLQNQGYGDVCSKCLQEKTFKETLKEEFEKNPFFITEAANSNTILHTLNDSSENLLATSTKKKNSKNISISRRVNQLYNSQVLVEGSTRIGENSLMEPSSLLNLSQSLSGGIGRLSPKPVNNYKPLQYNLPQTENVKFEQFLDVILLESTSTLRPEDQKEEITKYISALETSYNDMIRNLKERNEKLQRQLVKVRSQGANEVSERSEIEQLFIECIEEVRKEVMRRRFRNEIANQKSTATSTNVAHIKRLGAVRLSKTTISKNDLSQPSIVPNVMSDSEAKDFEESLYKLAQLQRKKVKIEDFTARDRFIILDLFVNNEKTLLKLYEALFPPRQSQDKHSPKRSSVKRTQGQSPSDVHSPLTTATKLPSIMMQSGASLQIQENLKSSARRYQSMAQTPRGN